MQASRYGETNIVELLLNSGANVHHANKYGDTALTLAGALDRWDIVELLLTYA
mgnify:CR=1 FL=1